MLEFTMRQFYSDEHRIAIVFYRSSLTNDR